MNNDIFLPKKRCKFAGFKITKQDWPLLVNIISAARFNLFNFHFGTD